MRGNNIAKFGGLSRATNTIVGLGLSEAQLREAKTLRSSQGEIVAVGGGEFSAKSAAP